MSIEQRGRLGDLCVTVATAANEAINLGTELELIKGVVLYADSIVVVSPQLNAMRDFAINTTSWGYGSPLAADDDPDAIRALTTYHRIRKGYGATDDEWLHMHCEHERRRQEAA